MDAIPPGATMHHSYARWVSSILVLASLVTGSLFYSLSLLHSTQAFAAGTLLSQDKTATASSLESSAYPASNAVDGDTTTRWSSAASDPQWLQVDLGTDATITQVVLQWETAYGKSYQIQTSSDASNWTTIYSTDSGAGGAETLNIAGSGRYVRMYGTARGTGYGYSLYEFQVYGSYNTSCGSTNLALNQNATASSTENDGTPASDAVDGSNTTRWSSAASDPQWLQVDLGSTQTLCEVVLQWETAYGKSYQIQTSSDASNWTTIYSTDSGVGGTETLFVSGSGRYIRMYGTARGTTYGYSLWEFQVYGATSGTTPTPTPTATSTPTSTPTATPTSTPTATPTATPTPTVNWSTVWEDDFNGAANTSPSSSNWLFDTGTSAPGGPANWGTGEVESMSNSTSNVSTDGNGHLNITALRDSSGNWTSGRIETQRDDFAAPAGGMMEITATLKQPNPDNALGYWPAFWTLGAGSRNNQTWPANGEVDIMEDVNGLSETAGTLHCGVAPNGPCNEYSGIGSGLASCTGCQTGYHTYAEVIDRTVTDEQLRWYVDGKQIGSVKESQVGVSTWQAAIDHGFFIIFDLAIGGSFPNGVSALTTPTAQTSSGGSLSVDSVAVLQTTGTPPTTMTPPTVPTGASVVSVTGTQGNWQLMVNGSPYYVKGVTYGPDTAAAPGYMPDLKSMGVNTVRTWGTDATTQPLLDSAAANGIKVINGFWLNQGEDYLNDTTYKTDTLNTIEQWVNTYKNDPAVLMWDVGNEVILTMQNTYSGTQLEQERDAYAQYVEQVVQAIHSIDPYHPVTSTDAWTGAWPYYKTYAPDLDLYAVNSYGSTCTVKQDWVNGNYTKPYILTESGPSGEWETANDENGVPTEPTDQQKATGYSTAWNCITGHTGVALGATLFNYGIENDFGGVWYNLRTGWSKRLSYYTVAQLYGGQAATNTPPVISNMTLSNTSVATSSQFTISFNVSDPNNDPLRYAVLYNSKYLDQSTALQYEPFTISGNTITATAPNKPGVWKVYVYVYDGQGNVGIETLSLKVVPPTVSGTNVAKGKTTTASSYQTTGTGAPYPPSNATDGDTSTRWASDWSDPQWIQVDLGQVTTLSHIQLYWESAYASAYQIQVSNDATNWTTIYSTTTGSGGVEDFNVSGSGRYVRLYGTQRGTTYGYSLYEFGIYTAS